MQILLWYGRHNSVVKRIERGSFLNSTLVLQQFSRRSILKHNQIIPFCLFHIFIPSLTELTKVADLVDEDSMQMLFCGMQKNIFFSVKWAKTRIKCGSAAGKVLFA